MVNCLQNEKMIQKGIFEISIYAERKWMLKASVVTYGER